MYRDGVDFRFTLIACLVEETKPEKKRIKENKDGTSDSFINYKSC